jgi:hypothetical protein
MAEVHVVGILSCQVGNPYLNHLVGALRCIGALRADTEPVHTGVLLLFKLPNRKWKLCFLEFGPWIARYGANSNLRLIVMPTNQAKLLRYKMQKKKGGTIDFKDMKVHRCTPTLVPIMIFINEVANVTKMEYSVAGVNGAVNCNDVSYSFAEKWVGRQFAEDAHNAITTRGKVMADLVECGMKSVGNQIVARAVNGAMASLPWWARAAATVVAMAATRASTAEAVRRTAEEVTERYETRTKIS